MSRRRWATPELTRGPGAVEDRRTMAVRREVAGAEVCPVIGLDGMVDVRLRASTWAWIKEVLRCAR